ncbi:MAG: hypothetical protein F6K54_21345 [Okeania sp. SIO3B5]|uniref:hypothetical protein n=1 Tax=Okeania sp. SIO3B5 TaxID=2607811 RepID=UPI0013FF611E|nr:hypothetical protein [Okeania sp. SIO3B5]NEO55387.1 hypothetical protein [Okeania sp. SIO3B5]
MPFGNSSVDFSCQAKLARIPALPLVKTILLLSKEKKGLGRASLLKISFAAHLPLPLR